MTPAEQRHSDTLHRRARKLRNLGYHVLADNLEREAQRLEGQRKRVAA